METAGTSAPPPAPSAPAPTFAPSPQPMDLPMAPTQNLPATIPDQPAPTPAPTSEPKNLQTQTQWSSYVPPPADRAPKPTQQPGPVQATEPTPSLDPTHNKPAGQQQTSSLPQSEPKSEPTPPQESLEKPLEQPQGPTGRYGYGPTATDILGNEFSTTPSEPYQQCPGECIAKGFSQACHNGERKWHSPRYAEGTRQEFEETVSAGATEALKRAEADKAQQQAQQEEAEHTKKRVADIKDEQLYQAHATTQTRQPSQQQASQQSTTQVAERDSLEHIANMPIWQGEDRRTQTQTNAPSAPLSQPTQANTATPQPAVYEENKPAQAQIPHTAQQQAPYDFEKLKADQDKRWAAQDALRQEAKEDPRLKTLGAIADHELADRPRPLHTISHEEVDRRLGTGISSRPAPSTPQTTESKRMDVKGLEDLFGFQFDRSQAPKRELEPWEKAYQETLKKHAGQQNPTSVAQSQQDAYRKAAGQTEKVGRTPAQQAEIDRQEAIAREHEQARDNRRQKSTPNYARQNAPDINPATGRAYPQTDIDPQHRPQTVPQDFKPQTFAPASARAPRSTATRSILRHTGLGSLANSLDQADLDLATPHATKENTKVLPEREERTRYALGKALGRHERTTIARAPRTRARATTMTTPIQGVEAHATQQQRLRDEEMWATRKAHELPTGFEKTASRQTSKEAVKELAQAAAAPVKTAAHAMAHPLKTFFPDTAWRLEHRKRAKAQQASATYGPTQTAYTTGYAQQQGESDQEKVAKAYGAKQQQQTQQLGHPNGKVGFVDPKTYWSISGVTSTGKKRKAITDHRIGANSKDCDIKECTHCSKEANILKGGSGRIGLPEVDSRGREEELSRKGYWVYRPDERTSHYASPTPGHLLEEEQKRRKGKTTETQPQQEKWKAFYYDTGESVTAGTPEEALAGLSERGAADYEVSNLTYGGTGYGKSKAEAGANLFGGRSHKAASRKGKGR